MLKPLSLLSLVAILSAVAVAGPRHKTQFGAHAVKGQHIKVVNTSKHFKTNKAGW